MISYVLDASVAVKWYLPSAGESLVEESQNVLELFKTARIRLSVPDLFWPEVANVFWKAVRTGRLHRNSGQEGLDTLSDLKIPTVSSAGLIHEALAIGLAFNRTVYDSMYVALAAATGRTLLTADERLANALAAYFPVRWLGSL